MASTQPGSSITGPYDATTKLALDAIITAVQAYIFTAVPFLNIPFFKQLTNIVVRKVLEIAAKEPLLWGAFLLIDSNIREKLKSYDTALEAFKLELKKPNQDFNNEAIIRAHEEWKKQLTNLVRMSKP